MRASEAALIAAAGLNPESCVVHASVEPSGDQPAILLGAMPGRAPEAVFTVLGYFHQDESGASPVLVSAVARISRDPSLVELEYAQQERLRYGNLKANTIDGPKVLGPADGVIEGTAEDITDDPDPNEEHFTQETGHAPVPEPEDATPLPPEFADEGGWS